MPGKTSEGTKRICIWMTTFLVGLHLFSCARPTVPSGKLSAPPEKQIKRKGVTHVVEPHQILYRICKTYGVTLQEVAALNRITDTGKIRVGQHLFIPGAAKIRKVDILIEDVVKESPGKDREPSTKIEFIWPVEGKQGNLFEDDERKRHQGIDISAPEGAPIRAASSGRVLFSGNTIRNYGNLIILRHSEEFVTVYAHNQANLVEEGSDVEKGQIIARVGRTGRASGPHLHFEVRKNNQAMDPLPFLR